MICIMIPNGSDKVDISTDVTHIVVSHNVKVKNKWIVQISIRNSCTYLFSFQNFDRKDQIHLWEVLIVKIQNKYHRQYQVLSQRAKFCLSGYLIMFMEVGFLSLFNFLSQNSQMISFHNSDWTVSKQELLLKHEHWAHKQEFFVSKEIRDYRCALIRAIFCNNVQGKQL